METVEKNHPGRSRYLVVPPAMRTTPFAYVALHREEMADYDGPERIQAPRLVTVRQTLREVITDHYLRSICRYPDCPDLEIIAVHPNGYLESLSVDQFAHSPKSRRHIHW